MSVCKDVECTSAQRHVKSSLATMEAAAKSVLGILPAANVLVQLLCLYDRLSAQ
jgi:hypothetical protein